MPMRAAVLLMLVACAKNVHRDEALARASVARSRGDFVGEALALRDACAAAPNDRDVCLQANQQWLSAQQRSQQLARDACRDVQPTTESVDTCLTAVGEIRKLAPADAEARKLAAVAMTAHSKRCYADLPQWDTSIDEAVELVRCLEARTAQIDLDLYRTQVLSARVNAKEQLLRLAEHPAYHDKPGATYELVASAMCLAPSPDLIGRAGAARGALVDKHRGSIDLRVTPSQPLPGLCRAVTDRLDTRAVCGAPKPGAPQITIVGEVTLFPVEHSAQESTESKEYVAGVIRFENPDYQPAVSDERTSRMAKESAERQWRRDESDCRSAESAASRCSSTATSCPERDERDRACNRESASESMYRSREREWESARRRLDSTPAIKERDDIRTATYSVRHHTWHTPWTAQLRSDGRTFTVSGATQATDRETGGASVAGVPSDPLTRPGDRWFVPAIRDQVAAKLAETVDVALDRRASDLAVSCPLPHQWTNEWLDCWARARFWGGEPAQADALIVLVGSTRQQWPQLQCAR
jgi:hypothetical protein